MKPKRGLLWIVSAFLLIGALILLYALGMQYLRWRQGQAQLDYLPPTIQIIEPQNGISVPIGSILTFNAAATFSPTSPVKTIEWWLDGMLVESSSLQQQAGAAHTLEDYDLLVPSEGTHLMIVRAINSRGVIGQSQPLTFLGEPKGDAFYAVALAEGQTLASLAADYGTDAATLQALNPDLGSAPVPGMVVKVPIPPEDEPPAALPSLVSDKIGVTLITTQPMLQALVNPPLPNLSDFIIATLPQAPTNLQGEVMDCRVRLVWEDNATSESSYEVWMAAPGSALTELAILQPASGGVAWYEFQAPGPGYFLFWVEAVNSIGQQGSNIISLNIDPACPAGIPTHLEAAVLDIGVGTAADRIYCYVSFENAPEVRLPAQDGNFIAVQNGHGDLSSWPYPFMLPIPQDDILDIRGECWGWSGQDLSKQGTFMASLASEAWDGTPRLIYGDTFEITLAITPQPAGGTKMPFGERSPDRPSGGAASFIEETLPTDPTLPIPVVTGMVPVTNNWLVKYCNPLCQSLQWKWDGDVTKIRGFAIFVDGKHYATFPFSDMRAVLVRPPIAACTDITQWQVAAVTATAMSQLSNPYPLWSSALGECAAYVKVTFDSLDLEWTHDGFGSGGPGDCDTMDAYFALHLELHGPAISGWNHATRFFYGTGGFYLPLRCGYHNLQDLIERVPDMFVYEDTLSALTVQSYFPIPVYPYYDYLRRNEFIVGGGVLEALDQPFTILVGANFLDHDSGSGADWIAKYGIAYEVHSFQDALDYFGCGRTFVEDSEDEEGRSQLQYSVTVYPNDCEPMPAVEK